MMLFIARPRSTITKQLDCCTSSFNTGTVEPSRNWPVRMPYQEACVSSTIASVPMVAEHFSSCELAFCALAPPAEPVAVVFAAGEPISMLEQAVSVTHSKPPSSKRCLKNLGVVMTIS